MYALLGAGVELGAADLSSLDLGQSGARLRDLPSGTATLPSGYTFVPQAGGQTFCVFGTGVDLTGVSVEGATVAGVTAQLTMPNGSLLGATLSDCDFTGSDFTGADLQAASLARVTMLGLQAGGAEPCPDGYALIDYDHGGTKYAMLGDGMSVAGLDLSGRTMPRPPPRRSPRATSWS